VERQNGSLRWELLDVYLFGSLNEARIGAEITMKAATQSVEVSLATQLSPALAKGAIARKAALSTPPGASLHEAMYFAAAEHSPTASENK
jgi:hypothetical protein